MAYELRISDWSSDVCSSDLEVTYSHLVLAAGCHERSVPFPGWTLPGVMMLGGLQLQIKSGVVKPPSPVVITGTGPLLPLVACQLHASGVAVAGVYDIRRASWRERVVGDGVISGVAG